MQRLVRILATISMLAAMISPLAAAPTAAYACSCAAISLPDRLEFTDTVFAGTATDVETWDGNGSSGTPVTIVFVADHAWLGDIGPAMLVHTAAAGASCGYTFEEGTRYLVYGKRRGDYVDAGLCSLTQPYNHKAVDELEAITGPGRIVPPGPPGSNPLPRATGDDRTGDAWAALRVAVTVAVAASVVFGLSRARELVK